MYSKLEQKIIQKSFSLLDMPNSRFKHFSFLVRKNSQIIGVYWNNSFKTHTTARKFHYRFETLHSELALMLGAKTIMNEEDFYRVKIYNVRINNHNKIAMSFPCLNCRVMLRSFGFREVYYTDNSGRFQSWEQ